jgi:hypothetical protein
MYSVSRSGVVGITTGYGLDDRRIGVRVPVGSRILISTYGLHRPSLWSSGQSSWLQIRRPGFDSRHYQKKKVVDLERGPLNLVSTTEDLLDRKVAAPV